MIFLCAHVVLLSAFNFCIYKIQFLPTRKEMTCSNGQ
jgi:hypothetical protein